MKPLLTALALSVLASPCPVPALTREAKRHEAAPAAPLELAAQGKKNPLPSGWFTWKFDRKPRLGTLIVKVQAFSKDGKRSTAYEITGECGMPSMPAHDTGPQKFLLNKKGDYLLPADIVMPGEWQIVIRVRRGGREIYAGRVLFNV